MLKRKGFILVLLFGYAFLIKGNQSVDFYVNGISSDKWEGATIQIQNAETNFDSITETKIKDGRFFLSGTFEKSLNSSPLLFASFRIEKAELGWFRLNVILENDTINIKLNDNLLNIKLSGSSIQKWFSGYYSRLNLANIRLYSIEDSLNLFNGIDSNSVLIRKLNQEKVGVYQKLASYLKVELLNRKEKYLYLLCLNQLNTFIYAKEFDFLKYLYENGQEYYDSQALSKIKSIAYNEAAVGKFAPVFKLPTFQGGFVSLTDYVGKIVFIDFWASWCKPCRAQVPKIKEIYNQLDTSKVEFIGISIDKNEESWKKAVIKEELFSFPQLIDNSKTKDKYVVITIPFNILINKKGKIIARDIPLEQLKSMME